jgi:hypothetical protein
MWKWTVNINVNSSENSVYLNTTIYISIYLLQGHVVVQLVEALHYKLEGGGFDSWWGQWNISLTKFFQPYCGPGVYSASNRNEFQ